MIPEDRRAVGGAHAGDVGQVLDGDRQAAEPSRLPLSLAALSSHQAPRVLAPALKAKGWQRVEGRLHLGDAPLGSIDQIERRDVAALKPRHCLRRRKSDQLIVHRRHRAQWPRCLAQNASVRSQESSAAARSCASRCSFTKPWSAS